MRLCSFLLLTTALVAQIQQRDLSIVRTATPAELSQNVQPPRGYAVVIAIATYKNIDPEQNLKYPESDAEAVYQTLIDKQAGNMEPENVKKLIGPRATLANIRAAIEDWLPSVAKESDRVIVYFAGHGLVDQGRGYLAPYDVDPRNIGGTGYPMDKLGTTLAQKVKSAWKVLLADACHSGKVTADSTQERVYSEFTKLPNNFLTLTSSRESESSYEDPNLGSGFGLFSYFLIQGWTGNADVDPRDGIVSADELIDFVRREVRNHARTRKAAQTPTERGDFPADMILGYSSKRRDDLRAKSGTAAPLPDGSLTIEVNLEDVEVYVDDQLAGKASPGKNLRIPGLSSGQHVVKGVRTGYDPASKEVMVYPGQEQTVTLRVQYKRNIKKASQDLYDEGMRIYSRRKAEADLKKARDLFIRALADDSRYSDAAVMVCLTEQILNMTEQGKKSCKRAVDLDPSSVDARVYYSGLLIESGDTREAIVQLTTATRQDPKHSQAHSNLAEAFLLAKSYDKAEEAAIRAIELSPKNSQGFLFRGDARRMQGRYAEAIVDYRRYLELDDFVAPLYQKMPVWLIGMGLSYRNAGQKRVFNTQRSSAFFGLCGCETELKNYLRAREYCEKAIGLDKDDANATYLLGTVFMDLFNRDNRRDYLVKAEQNLAHSLSLAPNADFAREAKLNLGRVREILPMVR